MSEIKGQLLGIILVLMIFGVVAAGLTAVFTNLTDSVTSEVKDLQSNLETISYISLK